jgi:hypothetical protein
LSAKSKVPVLSKNSTTTIKTEAASLAKSKDGGEKVPANKTKTTTLAKTKEDEPTLHIYRHDAWNEGHLNHTNKDEYEADSPQAYVVEPLEIGGQSFLIMKNKLSKKDPTLHVYRHEAWNEANFNATHVNDYSSGTTASGATLPEHEVNSGYLVEPIALETPAGSSAPGGASGFLAVANKKSSRL